MNTESEAREYLHRMLALDPSAELVEIAISRHERLRAKDPNPRRADEPRLLLNLMPELQEREHLEAQLDALRSRIDDLTDAEMIETLRTLNFEAAPDLAVEALRLRACLRIRPRLASLRNNPELDPEFMDFMDRFMMATPRNKVLLRRAAFTVPFRNPRAAARSIKMLLKEFPEIYRFNSRWLKSLARALRKRRNFDPENPPEPPDYSFEIPTARLKTWWIWLSAFILLRILMKLAVK